MQSPSHPSPEPTASTSVATKRHWGVILLWITPVLFVAGVLLYYGLLTRQGADSDTWLPRVGQPLADFTLPDLHGRMVQLSALRGKVVFINVWATWCKPCIDEMPTIQRLYDHLRTQGLEVLAINLDPLGEEVVTPFMRNYRLSFPVLLDRKSSVERLYGTTGVPETFIVDKQGLLVDKIIGPRDWAHPQMLAMFQRLLAAPVLPQKGSS